MQQKTEEQFRTTPLPPLKKIIKTKRASPYTLAWLCAVILFKANRNDTASITIRS